MTDELRYTPDELFDLYVTFLKNPDMQARLKKQNIHTHEHEELLLRFLAYLKNVDYIYVKREVEVQKWTARYPGDTFDDLWKRSRGITKTWPKKENVFDEPTDGTLFAKE